MSGTCPFGDDENPRTTIARRAVGDMCDIVTWLGAQNVEDLPHALHQAVQIRLHTLSHCAHALLADRDEDVGQIFVEAYPAELVTACPGVKA